MKKKTSRLLNFKFWIDFILPNRCPVCGKVILWNELVCDKCEKVLPFLDDKSCLQYKDKMNGVDKLCAVFEYSGKAVTAVYNLKKRKGMNFAEYSAKYICRYLTEKGETDIIDAVTFVPMAKAKRKSRGYNQAEKLAVFVAKELEKPLIKDALVHLPEVREQHTLNSEQRQENARSVYRTDPNHADIKGKNILLCDDVVTTGATMNNCGLLLKSMGAKSVYGAAACSTFLKEYISKNGR